MKKELRNFGLIWSLIFFVIAFFPLFSGNGIRIWSAYVSGVFTTVSLLAPDIFEKIRFYQTWIKFGNFVGNINSKIIIFILFYVIFLPIGLILKLLGKDLLRKKIVKSCDTYFVDRNPQVNNMKNQF